MLKRTLRDISAEIIQLVEELQDVSDTEAAASIIEELDALQIEQAKKLDSIAHVRIEQRADVKAIDDEIKRLQARKRAITAAGQFLDHYVMGELKRQGITRHKGRLANISIRKSPVACEVVDIEAVPDEYKETRVEVKVLKSDAILANRNSDDEIPGLRFTQGEHIRIR